MPDIAAIKPPPVITLGFYVTVEINGYKLYCSPTLFEDRTRAERWRERWQRRLVAYTVSLEEVTEGGEVKY